jgi:hypothetical protein
MAKSPFLDSISDFMRTRRYSKRTVDSYLLWIKAFIVFHAKNTRKKWVNLNRSRNFFAPRLRASASKHSYLHIQGGASLHRNDRPGR